MESILNLKDKIAFITGSTRGIGWAIAQQFAALGATVLINGRSDETIVTQRVAEIKESYNVVCEGFCFDVANPDALKLFYQQVLKSYKRIDILVNNAGILEDALIGMITSSMLERIYNTNVNATLMNLQYASKLMIRNNLGGSIINMASILGVKGNVGQTAYSASKAAVIGITMSAAKEMSQHKIRVNAVAPGYIETDMLKSLNESKAQQIVTNIGLKRFGKPEEVAKLVAFLASDASQYITGQVINIDGGLII